MDAPSDTTFKASGVTRESARWPTTVRAVRRLRATRRQADVVLLLGLGAVVVLAAVLRLIHIGAHLPGLVTPDEPTVMNRALGLLHGRIPQQWDWPTGAMDVLAGAVGLGRMLTPWLSRT